MKKAFLKRVGTSPTLLGAVGVALVLIVITALVVRQTSAASPDFNNAGISADGATFSTSFDGSGFDYSNNALQAAGFLSGQSVTVNGVSFQWPTVTPGVDDNWLADRQAVAVDAPGATFVAFLGSATGGPSSGTGILTYTDSSTQNFTLAFSDWTLNAGRSAPVAGNSVAATMSYRNNSAGVKQVVKTYLFFTSVALAAGKTLQSVTLPNTVNQGALHVFAVGTSSSPAPAFNNEGISPDSVASGANFDGWGNNYSNDALQAAGFTPGAAVLVNGASFEWPPVGIGTNDNWKAAGQVIPVTAPGATVLGFLGSATNGPSSGTVVLTYTDGSTQSVTLVFSDWTLNAGASPVLGPDSIAATLSYRNMSNGTKQAVKTYLFYTSVTLAAGKTLKSVTLPTRVSRGALHVFAVGTVTPPTSGLNNEGISADGAANANGANFDNGGYSYSDDALQDAGFASGQMVTVNGVSFQWPTVGAGKLDNWNATGQVISISAPGALELGFLGASAYGPASGTVTLTYTDNTTQIFTLAFSDWTLNGGRSAPLAADTIAATMSYRNTQTGGKDPAKTYLFFTSVPLSPGKTLKSVTLPGRVNQGALHVFAIGTGTTAPASSLNNEGINADGTAVGASFDGVGFDYSNSALQAAGFASGQMVTVNGVSFQWPTVGAGTNDNWQTAGQTIARNAPNATILGFLGSATGGPASGTAVITYTDDSTQSFTLVFSDWTLNAGKSPVLPLDTIVASMSYRNTSNGGKQAVNTYLFFTSVMLAPGKTLQSVTLPNLANQGALHVFAIGTTAGPQGTATWPTYLGDDAGSSFNGAETAITPQTAANLKLSWSAQAGGTISDQPIVGNGMVYWGSWDGYLHATNFAGTQVWETNLGTTTGGTSCNPRTVGIAGSAALGTINGTPAVFISGGNANFYALNALSGAIIWQTRLGPSPATFLWGSPIVYNGSVFIGSASLGDCPLTQGKLIKLDANSGAIQGIFDSVPNGCVGGGIWSTPTLDTNTGMLYASTGTQSPGCGPNTSVGIVAVRASDMTLASSWEVPSSQFVFDSDFGVSPTLFTAAIPNTSGLLVGVANKNGLYYAFDRTNLAAGPVWVDQIADPGSCPQCGSGSIASSVWDGTTLYVAGGNTTIGGTACAGGVRAVNPATGAFKWEACLQSGPVLAAPTGVPGVLFVGAGSSIVALASASGKTLFTFHDGASGSDFFGPATVVNGVLYEGNMDAKFYAFSL